MSISFDTFYDANPANIIAQSIVTRQTRLSAGVGEVFDVIPVVIPNENIEYIVCCDGVILHIYPDSGKSSGYGSKVVPLQSTKIAAGYSSESGRIFVLSWADRVLMYASCDLSRQRKWDGPHIASLPPVEHVFVEGGSPLKVGALCSDGNGGYSLYAGSNGDYSGNIYFGETKFVSDSINCVWEPNNSIVIKLGHTLSKYDIDTEKKEDFRFDGPSNPVDIAAVSGDDGISYYARQTDGELYELSMPAAGGVAKWRPISPGLKVSSFTACTGANNRDRTIMALVLDQAWHLPFANGSWAAPIPVFGGIGRIASARDWWGNLFLPIVRTDRWVELLECSSQGYWSVSPLDLDDKKALRDFNCFSTEITVMDAGGAVLPGVTVSVNTQVPARVVAGGRLHQTGPSSQALALKTDASGRVVVVQPSSGLWTPFLTVSAGSKVNVVVRPEDQARSVFEKLSPETLLQAKAGNDYLLQGPYHGPDTAKAVAASIGELLKLQPVRRTGHPINGVEGVGADRLEIPHGARPWEISFSESDAAFRFLSDQEAAKIWNDAGGVNSIFDAIGDVVASVASGIASVAKMVVSYAGNVVNATIEIVVNGIKRAFNFAIKTIQGVYSVMETVFEGVKVAFGKLVDFLGSLFGWNDIIRSQDAIAYTIEQALVFLEGALDGTRRIIDDGLDRAVTMVDEIFAPLMRSVGDQTIGGYVQSQQPKSGLFAEATSNNFVLNQVSGNLSVIKITPAGPGGVAGDNPIAILIRRLTELSDQISGLPEYQGLLDVLKRLGKGPEAVGQIKLAELIGLLKLVIKVVIMGVKTAIDVTFDILIDLVKTLRSLLTSAIDVPVISQIFEKVTKHKLNVLNVVGLIVAIPSMIVYKAVRNEAPFADDAALQVFKNSFNADILLYRAGFKKPADGLAVPPAPGKVEGPMLLLSVGAILAGSVSAFLSAAEDLSPAQAPEEPGRGNASRDNSVGSINMVCRLTALALGTPWLTSSALPSCSTEEGASQILWLYDSFNFLLDGAMELFIKADGEENGGVVKPLVGMAAGIGHAITLGIVWTRVGNAWERAGTMMAISTEVAKGLNLIPVRTATLNISSVVLASIDAIGGVGSAICAFVVAVSDTEIAFPRPVPVPIALVGPAAA